jgi:hypothetical protein
VKGSGNIVLNPAVVKGERKKNERGLNEDQVMDQAVLVAQGTLASALEFAAGTRQLVPCGSKVKREGHWRCSYYWPWSAENQWPSLTCSYEDPQQGSP